MSQNVFPFRLPLVLDGSTGISLYRRGMPQGVCVEQWVAEHPDVLLELQRAFLDAGSDAVYAPTFGANRPKLSHYGLGGETVRLNETLTALSRRAAGDKLVGGDMTTTGLFIEPLGDASFDQVLDAYREQADALAHAGADFLVAETMMNLYEMRAAVLAGRETGLPVFVTATVDERGRTLSGASGAACYTAVRALGAAAFGFNCSFGPEGMLDRIRELAPYADIPLIAKPNAGMPCEDHPFCYDLSPERMGEAMSRLLEAGARIVGGCCGASPEYVAAIRAAVDRFDPDTPAPAGSIGRVLTDGRNVFRLTGAETVSDEIPVGDDLADELMDCEDDIAAVRLGTPEDAEELARNLQFRQGPVCLCAGREDTLERALLLYQGRPLVRSSVPECAALCGRYGALREEDVR